MSSVWTLLNNSTFHHFKSFTVSLSPGFYIGLPELLILTFLYRSDPSLKAPYIDDRYRPLSSRYFSFNISITISSDYPILKCWSLAIFLDEYIETLKIGNMDLHCPIIRCYFASATSWYKDYWWKLARLMPP